jgi:hypothetical protein
LFLSEVLSEVRNQKGLNNLAIAPKTTPQVSFANIITIVSMGTNVQIPVGKDTKRKGIVIQWSFIKRCDQ